VIKIFNLSFDCQRKIKKWIVGIGMVGNCLLEALRYIKLTNFTKLVCVNGDDIESCEAVF